MKILFCDNSIRELLLFRGDIINHFKKDNEIILVAPNNFNKKVKIDEGIKYYDISLERSSINPFKEIKYFLQLLKIYFKNKPDYIFHYTIKPNIYGTIAASILKIPSTAVVAGLGYFFSNKGLTANLIRRLFKLSLRKADKIITLNKDNYSVLKEMGLEKQLILLPGGEGINLENYK